MNIRNYLLSAMIVSMLTSCSHTIDSCDDLAGTLTHTVTQITGIDSATVSRRVPDSLAVEAIDQISGTEFSNLVITIELSWIEEQHRFRAPNTINQSWVDWFIKPARACTLASYEEIYKPGVSAIELHSDNNLNDDYLAGAPLAEVFTEAGLNGNNQTLRHATDTGTLLSAREYSVVPAWQNGSLATTPMSPSTHIFTLLITLTDGQSFEIRTPEVLISGS